MGKRKIDARSVKTHRNYTVFEAAQCLGVHKNTIQQWLKKGLPHLDDRRPFLILGHDLKDFLRERRRSSRKPCPPGHLFCLRCRAPRRPAGGLLDYEPFSSSSGNLKGICEVCETFIFRRVSLARIDAVTANCDVAFPQRQERLIGKT